MPVTSLYYQPQLTLPDLLNRAVINDPELYIGFCDKNGIITTQTYKDLLSETKKIAAGFHNMGLRKGDKLIIAVQHNQETIELLWGCFLLGIVPTILQPPMTFSGYNPSVVKLMNVYEQLDRPYVFMSDEVKETGDLPAEKVKHKEDLVCDGEFPDPDLKPEDLAFVQFSSGSTGDPKGIMLTHRNIMINLDAIRIGLDLKYPDRFGNWMPLFHDMGLIGYHLTPLYCSINQYQINVMDFIMFPVLWLNLMSQEKIAISGCTNFGLNLVLRYLKRKQYNADWDFSVMKALLNGAEPISVKIMHEFVETLVPHGFRPEAMMPVYGMAEATLAISFPPLLQLSKVTAFDTYLLDREAIALAVDNQDLTARILTEVGKALNDIEIRIVDQHDKQIPEGRVGHIQIKGDGITTGYYNKPGPTENAFCGKWLRTGDIGFFLEGRLYISGRYKDIIFKNSRNYFANDLEMMASTIEEIEFGKICFSCRTDS